MRGWIAKLSALAAMLAGLLLAPAEAQVTLTWNPSPSSDLAGYNLCWGVSSGVYGFTNMYPPSQTSGTVSNLATNQAYFFAVQAFATNGLVSPFSNEESFTNGPPSTNVGDPGTNGPPTPPGGTNISSPTNTGGGSSSGSGGSGTAGSGGSGTFTNSAANFWGVPPFLTMPLTNGQPTMNIGGTVGATLMIQATTNISSLDSWETMTNLALTNLASVGQTNQGSQDALDLAFVPALQAFPITASNGNPFQFFRVVMPYDYVILASMVLPGKGYGARLIVVNMPGIVDDACYVSQAGSFIHYCPTNSALQLEGAGSTLRNIASTLANSLSLDWTSASEFTYSNGLSQIWATVIETEPASSDPVAGQNPPSQPMVIDF